MDFKYYKKKTKTLKREPCSKTVHSIFQLRTKFGYNLIGLLPIAINCENVTIFR